MEIPTNELSVEETVRGLLAGDFSRLEPLFRCGAGQKQCRIIAWFEEGRFKNEKEASAEAFTCACFNGCVEVVEYLLARGADVSGGIRTGLNAVHWAANRGQLEAVRILLRHMAPLETLNNYGGTVLGCAVWSAMNEPKSKHAEIIDELIRAGAKTDVLEGLTGSAEVDEVLKRHGIGR
jgi:hypothetical protein